MQGETVTKPSFRVQPGQQCQISITSAEECGLAAEDIPLEIAYEDRHVLVLNKPPGLVVHPGAGNPSGTLVNALVHYHGEELPSVGGRLRPGIVHRLDKNTSGLIAVAKTDLAMQSLTRQLACRSMRRAYMAVVRGVPGQSSECMMSTDGVQFGSDGSIRISTMIRRHSSRRTRQAVVRKGGKPAKTFLKVRQRLAQGTCSLIDCVLETGRTHQIRVHCAHIGHPVIGDSVYGAGARMLPASVPAEMRNAVARFPRQALHACKLVFEHPESGRRTTCLAPFPEDMQTLLGELWPRK